MEKEAVRWNIKVSKETDLTLRTYLGSQGMKKGDLSKFIEEALDNFALTPITVLIGPNGAGRAISSAFSVFSES